MLRPFPALSFAVLLSLVGACKDSSEAATNDAKASWRDACEHLNEACADEVTSAKDCDKSQAIYDDLPDADKKDADEQIDCAMAKETCDDVMECLGMSGPSGSATTKPTKSADAGE